MISYGQNAEIERPVFARRRYPERHPVVQLGTGEARRFAGTAGGRNERVGWPSTRSAGLRSAGLRSAGLRSYVPFALGAAIAGPALGLGFAGRVALHGLGLAAHKMFDKYSPSNVKKGRSSHCPCRSNCNDAGRNKNPHGSLKSWCYVDPRCAKDPYTNRLRSGIFRGIGGGDWRFCDPHPSTRASITKKSKSRRHSKSAKPGSKRASKKGSKSGKGKSTRGG